MSGSFQEITLGIVQGIRDGILGILKIKRLSELEEAKEKEKVTEPRTVLASRRAEKLKGKELKEKKKKSSVTQKIVLCCAWNGGVFWMSIILFNFVVLPCLQWFISLIFGGSGMHSAVWGWIGPLLSWTFSALWILPLFLLSKIVNTFWYQDIADAAYYHTRGRPCQPNISDFIADISFSVVLQIFFLMQATLFIFLPIPAIADVISIFHMSLLYSLYAFEYKWLNMGWKVHHRLKHIENHWPYFCGFGLPLAILTSLHPSILISGCIFSLLFPLFIISANEAGDPTQCSFPLKLFAVVVSISNTLFSAFTPHGRSQKTSVPKVPPSGKSPKKVGISDTRDYR